MSKDKEIASKLNIEENVKIGITLLILGSLILTSMFFIFEDSNQEKERTADTTDLIDRSGKFVGGSLIIAGIVLTAVEINKKFTKPEKP